MGFEEDHEYVKTLLLKAGVGVISKDNIVGYCRYPEHKGAITKNILKNQGCLKKNCRYFSKDLTNPYWDRLKEQQDAVDKKKRRKAALKAEEKQRYDNLLSSAQELADEMSYEIKIRDVYLIPGQKTYLLWYVSKKEENDCYDYFEFAKALGKQWKAKVKLVHKKNKNGKYIRYL